MAYTWDENAMQDLEELCQQIDLEGEDESIDPSQEHDRRELLDDCIADEKYACLDAVGKLPISALDLDSRWDGKYDEAIIASYERIEAAFYKLVAESKQAAEHVETSEIGTTYPLPPKTKKVGRQRSGTHAALPLWLVQEQPGITIPELAAKMGVKQNYLYRVLPGLEQEGKVEKKGRGWYPITNSRLYNRLIDYLIGSSPEQLEAVAQTIVDSDQLNEDQCRKAIQIKAELDLPSD